MTTERLQTIERELGALRTSVRRWKATSTLLIIGAGLLAAGAYGPTVLDHLIVNRLDIVGKAGSPVVTFSESDSGGRIDLYNQSGINTLRLASSEHGGDLAIWNQNGKNVAGIWSTEKGGSVTLWDMKGDVVSTLTDGVLVLSGDNALLQVQNDSGTSVALVGTDKDGNGRIQIGGNEGNVITEMRMIPGIGGGVIVMTEGGKEMGVFAATDNGGQIHLKNHQEVSVFVASATQDNAGGAIRIANERGVPILILSADDSHRGLIEVLDEDGHGVRRLHPIRGYSP
ncbi:MAG TPA: hypothetical protein EYO05_06420 [Gammaproteobacteria bacterium]|nr:hypothetical protein [Gammaproteobacteria bacterium]